MTPVEFGVVAFAAGSLFFSVVAAVGIVRFPDVYSRAHATSKSDTLGTGLALLAAGLALDSGVGRLKLVFLVVFVVLTNPVAAHAITRAAYRQGIPVWRSETEADEWTERARRTEDDE